METTTSMHLNLADHLRRQPADRLADKTLKTDGLVRETCESGTVVKIVFAFILLVAVPRCRARIISVDDDEPADFNTIQAAIDDADSSDTVLLGPGIYRGTGNRDIDFHGKAITVRSTNPADPAVTSATVIDCQGTSGDNHRAFIFQSNEDERSIINGITMTGGYADQGGAVDCKPYCSPAITNCVIRGNVAAEGDGGGINCLTSEAKILNCLVEDNTAKVYGGGVSCCDSSDLVISNCIIRNNSSGDDGGGFQCCRSHATVQHCLFEGNISRAEGGGIWCIRPIVVDHCTIVGNRAGLRGGGLASNWDPCVITNSIIRDNLSEDLFLRSTDSEVSYCNCVLVGEYPGVGNMDVDPCFAEAGQWVADPCDPGELRWSSGDCHLKSQAGRWEARTQSWIEDVATSPCIDSGDPASPIGLEPFPNGGIVNMGAYGGTAEASKSYFDDAPCETIVAGDLNGDCAIDYRDLCILAWHWYEDNRVAMPGSP